MPSFLVIARGFGLAGVSKRWRRKVWDSRCDFGLENGTSEMFHCYVMRGWSSVPMNGYAGRAQDQDLIQEA